MKESLINLKKGLKGLVVLSEELENVGNSLFDNQVKKIKHKFIFYIYFFYLYSYI